MVWFANGKPIVYSKFLIGQPDNAGNNEACVEVFVDHSNKVFWNDFICDQKIGYICQKYVSNSTYEVAILC